MRDTVRRMRTPGWWVAHKGELPTWQHLVIFALVVIILTGCGVVINAARVVELAQDDLKQNQRILECLNKKGAIGSVNEYGADWDVECHLILRKRS